MTECPYNVCIISAARVELEKSADYWLTRLQQRSITVTCWPQKKTVFIHFDQADTCQLVEIL